MGSAGQELKKLLRDLERGTEDEELREELRGIRLRLEAVSYTHLTLPTNSLV